VDIKTFYYELCQQLQRKGNERTGRPLVQTVLLLILSMLCMGRCRLRQCLHWLVIAQVRTFSSSFSLLTRVTSVARCKTRIKSIVLDIIVCSFQDTHACPCPLVQFARMHIFCKSESWMMPADFGCEINAPQHTC
jgi:hypothetical protein